MRSFMYIVMGPVNSGSHGSCSFAMCCSSLVSFARSYESNVPTARVAISSYSGSDQLP